MGITVRDLAGIDRAITGIKVRDGSLLRTILRVKVVDADGTTLRTVATFSPPMTASASPSSVEAYAFSASPATINGGPVTVTPSGGTAPYAYSWSVLSYDAPSPPTFSNATSAATLIVQAGVPDGEAYSATVSCTVTDAFGQTAAASVSALFANNSFN